MRCSLDEVVGWAEVNGFLRTPTVRDTGEYAVRGGIVDLFPPGLPAPVRLDFFGDTLDSLRAFDPETQRTMTQMRALDLVPMSEFQLTTETMRRFRMGYVATFGAATKGDPLYEAVSEGRRFPGMEHWLPLFHEKLDTLFDYLEGTPVLIEAQAEEAAGERLTQIADYYEARREALEHPGQGSGAPYKPLKPDALYLTSAEWEAAHKGRALVRLSPFALPEARDVIDLDGRPARSFAPERADPEINLFEAAATYLRELAGKKRTVLAAWSDGSRDRLATVLADHGLKGTERVGSPRCRRGAAEGRHRPRRARHRERLRDRRARRHRRAGHSRRPSGAAEAQGAPPAGHHRRADLAHRGRSRGACRPRHRALRRPQDHRGDGRAARLPRNPLCGRAPSCSCRWRISNCCRAMARRIPRRSSTGSAAAAGRRARRRCAAASARWRPSSSRSRPSASSRRRRGPGAGGRAL